MNHFYVYIYLDPRKSGQYVYGDYQFEYEPFYVGKGSDINGYQQCLTHLKESKKNKSNNLFKHNKIRKIVRETDKDPIILKVKENLTEQEAFDLEIYLIKKIGRRDLNIGTLTNMTDGGEGVSGWVVSEETRKKMSLNNLGKNNPMYGKRGNLNHMYGKISPMLGKTHTKETKKKISLANYGKTHTKETKRKMSLARIGKKLSEETKKKLSVANKGKIPWHKGQIDVYSKESNLKRSETHKKILHRAKNYILISPEGIEIKVFNLNGFCNDNDLSIRCMTQVVCGRQKQHKGWKFKEKW